MTTETILTDREISQVLSQKHLLACPDNITAYDVAAAREIEQAVLQSPEVQAWKRDAERYRWIERQSDAWAVLGAAYDLSSEYDGVSNLSESIDAAMEKQK